MTTETLKVCGLTEAEIAGRLSRFANADATFTTEEHCLDAKITVTSELPPEAFERLKTAVYNAFEEEVYSAGDNELHVLAAKLLKLNGKTLSVAESLTGGEICSRLTQNPGISGNFFEGIVCYNRASKMRRLSVSRSILGEYGAVSRETAYEMVRGLLVPPVDIGLATTGLAGPEGDEGKPVGLVYIGVGEGRMITVFERRLSGTRNEIRHAAANVALFYLVRFLKNDIYRL